MYMSKRVYVTIKPNKAYRHDSQQEKVQIMPDFLIQNLKNYAKLYYCGHFIAVLSLPLQLLRLVGRFRQFSHPRTHHFYYLQLRY